MTTREQANFLIELASRKIFSIDYIKDNISPFLLLISKEKPMIFPFFTPKNSGIGLSMQFAQQANSQIVPQKTGILNFSSSVRTDTITTSRKRRDYNIHFSVKHNSKILRILDKWMSEANNFLTFQLFDQSDALFYLESLCTGNNSNNTTSFAVISSDGTVMTNCIIESAQIDLYSFGNAFSFAMGKMKFLEIEEYRAITAGVL